MSSKIILYVGYDIITKNIFLEEIHVIGLDSVIFELTLDGS